MIKLQKRGQYDAEIGLRFYKGYKTKVVMIGLWWYNIRMEIR